jgi:transcriptional regulator with XRE-family HTH domain
LREKKKWSQRDLVLAMAEMGTDTTPESISKLETGGRPYSQKWMDALLTALEADYSTYQEAMEMAGHQPRLIEPTEQDIERAHRKAEVMLNSTPYPSYLADCLLRIISWNAAFDWLDPLKAYGPLLQRNRISILDMVFGSKEDGPKRGDFMQFVENPEEIYGQQIRILYHDWQQAQDEPWYKEMLPRLLKHPLFHRMWKAAEEEAVTMVDAEEAQYTLRVTPYHLKIMPQGPSGPTVRLTFFTSYYPIPEDKRFRVVTFHPSDSDTMRWLIRWSEENGKS